MKKRIQTILRYLNLFGIDPIKLLFTIRGLPYFYANYLNLKKQRPNENDLFNFGSFYPCLDDKYAASGQTKGHYFHQDLLVAKRIYNNQPKHHVDVGSRVDGFVAHVASYREISVIDIRPLTSQVNNITFLQADLMKELPAELLEYCDSLSCLHALEHFGLGRYGDSVCWNGYLIGFHNLIRLLKPGGKFYFSVPIGEQRIEYNAHRVFSITYLIKMFTNHFHIDNFSFVNDLGDLQINVSLDEQNILKNYDCHYGCGIFEMTKL